MSVVTLTGLGFLASACDQLFFGGMTNPFNIPFRVVFGFALTGFGGAYIYPRLIKTARKILY